MGATCHVRTGTGGQTRGQIEGYPFYIWQSDLIVHYALLEKRRDKIDGSGKWRLDTSQDCALILTLSRKKNYGNPDSYGISPKRNLTFPILPYTHFLTLAKLQTSLHL